MAKCKVEFSHSMGSTTSTPHTNCKGVNPMDSLTIMW